MSQFQSLKSLNEYEEYECSGNGPRPPVPGKECQMTESVNVCGAYHAPSMADDAIDDCIRVAKWQDKLENLLADKKGMELFRRFVEHEAGPHGIHTIHLEFLFACEGLKEHTDENMLRQIIGAIYRKYLRKDIPLKTELRNNIKRILKNELPPNANIYDDLRKEVQATINKTTYPNFLMSDFYRSYTEDVQKAGTKISTKYEPNLMTSVTGESVGNLVMNTIPTPSGCTSAVGSLSPCDSLGASCSNLPDSIMVNSLPTLHEDSELAHGDLPAKPVTVSKPKLTKDLLLATQSRRLEVRPPGAHGYNISFTSSFNPVSRQDSEYQSCSSASLTDSDTKSLVSSKDGQPYLHRKHSSSESIRKNYMNPSDVGTETLVEPFSRSRLRASKPMDPKTFIEVLTGKLKLVKEDQDKKEHFNRVLTEMHPIDEHQARPIVPTQIQQTHQKALTAAILRKISPQIEDNDQDILDQHVSRVFSPLVSPGTSSPRQTITTRPLPPIPPRSVEHPFGNDSYHDNSTFSIRHSRSIPEHASRKSNKYAGSNYYDSGISVGYSTYKSSKPTNRELQLEETRRLLEDESRRNRMQSAMSQSMGPSSTGLPPGHHTNSLPRPREQNEEFTSVLYSFCEESLKYRMKIPGRQPTLKQFIEQLPKKGNFRYFFRAECDDPDCPIIQEEFTNELDLLPIIEGKIVGSVKQK